jgi:hypothetical protein
MNLNIREKRRLKMCDAALRQMDMKKPHPCYFNAAEKKRVDIMDGLTRECLERERNGLIRKEEHIATTDTPATLGLWKIKDAAADFVFSNTAAERAGKRQALEDLMRSFFTPASITAYLSSLAATPLKVRPIDSVYGGIFVAEVEGCDDFDRIVGYYDFGDEEPKQLNGQYQGLENATAVHLLPNAEIVSWEIEIQSTPNIKTPKDWAYLEMREQVYTHGIAKTFTGGACRLSTHISICLSKKLCVRCGGTGHTSAICRATHKAAWAGGDLIARLI